jgi:hypothetical protein
MVLDSVPAFHTDYVHGPYEQDMDLTASALCTNEIVSVVKIAVTSCMMKDRDRLFPGSDLWVA